MRMHGLVDIKQDNCIVHTNNHATANMMQTIFSILVGSNIRSSASYSYPYDTPAHHYGIFLPGYYYTSSGTPTKNYKVYLGKGGFTPSFAITALQSSALGCSNNGITLSVSSGYSTGGPIDVLFTGVFGASELETAFGIQTGNAQAGGSTTITLSSGASAVDDTYNNKYIVIKSGTGVDQIRKITDYDGTGKVATVETVWDTNPSTDSVYYVYDPVTEMGLNTYGASLPTTYLWNGGTSSSYQTGKSSHFIAYLSVLGEDFAPEDINICKPLTIEWRLRVAFASD